MMRRSALMQGLRPYHSAPLRTPGGTAGIPALGLVDHGDTSRACRCPIASSSAAQPTHSRSHSRKPGLAGKTPAQSSHVRKREPAR